MGWYTLVSDLSRQLERKRERKEWGRKGKEGNEREVGGDAGDGH